jgi:hypothetical protein
MANRVVSGSGAFALTFLLACGGSTVGSGATRGQSPTGDDGGVASSSASVGSDADGGFGAAAIAAATAACDAPHGDPSAVTDKADFTSRVSRAWYLCSVTDPTGLVASPVAHSIILTADGSWQYLLPDANGNLVPARGIDNEGTYTACDSCGSIGGMPTWMIYGPNDWFVRFEAQPTRLRIDVATAGWIEWYVPLGDP